MTAHDSCNPGVSLLRRYQYAKKIASVDDILQLYGERYNSDGIPKKDAKKRGKQSTTAKKNGADKEDHEKEMQHRNEAQLEYLSEIFQEINKDMRTKNQLEEAILKSEETLLSIQVEEKENTGEIELLSREIYSLAKQEAFLRTLFDQERLVSQEWILNLVLSSLNPSFDSSTCGTSVAIHFTPGVTNTAIDFTPSVLSQKSQRKPSKGLGSFRPANSAKAKEAEAQAKNSLEAQRNSAESKRKSLNLDVRSRLVERIDAGIARVAKIRAKRRIHATNTADIPGINVDVPPNNIDTGATHTTENHAPAKGTTDKTVANSIVGDTAGTSEVMDASLIRDNSSTRGASLIRGNSVDDDIQRIWSELRKPLLTLGCNIFLSKRKSHLQSATTYKCDFLKREINRMKS